MTTVSHAKRWANCAAALMAAAWLLLSFEFYWTDGEIVREHTPWFPHLSYALFAGGMVAFLAAWQKRNKNT